MKNKPMLRVVAILAAALLILIFASRLSIKHTEQAMLRYADKETERKSDYASKILNMLFQAGEWSVYSFLSGFADMEIIPDSSTYTGYIFRTTIRDEERQTLTPEEIFARLKSYLAYNYDCHAAIAIFEPDALTHVPQGIAAKISPEGCSDLLKEDYTVYESSFYQSVKSSHKMFDRCSRVGRDSLQVFTYGIPFFSEQGTVIGEFWIDIEADTYSAILKTHKTSDEVTLFFIDQDCRIASAADKEYNGRPLREVAFQDFGRFFSEGWYAQVQECNRLDTICSFRNEVHGELFVTTLLPIQGTPYKLLIVKSAKSIYTDINRSIAIASIIMVVCFVLVAGCLILIFRVMKRKQEEGNRMKNELNVAATIQRGILPQNIGSTESFDIYGFQQPAKIVGGDLYDFDVKGDLLHFCIGDVSGKGVPAAMVMTELCSLYRYVNLRYYEPAEIVRRINDALMERSDDTMMCTLFVGVLNLRSGLLRYCNAGHNPPIVMGSGVTRYLSIKPNMPIYAFAGYPYQEESLQLVSGDRLFFYTDGVTEAKNAEGQFFGNEATLHLIDRLQRLPFDQLVPSVQDALQRFVQKAEQHDDITMLCVGYKGCGSCQRLHYDRVSGQVTEIVNAVLQACHRPDDMRLRLAIEEPVQNIADYAYATNNATTNDGPLDVEVWEQEQHLEIILRDSGTPFNPLQQASPDFSTPIEERQVGGLGIYLTRQVMETVDYRHADKQNILTLKYSKI